MFADFARGLAVDINGLNMPIVTVHGEDFIPASPIFGVME